MPLDAMEESERYASASCITMPVVCLRGFDDTKTVTRARDADKMSADRYDASRVEAMPRDDMLMSARDERYVDTADAEAMMMMSASEESKDDAMT